ncbi:MAG: dihydrodipicolinate synthase family protein [Chloroflexi bacterium]|nr:dihydrodipicolinate synthase family protein [Chloroflexota bacterium]
MRELRLDGLIPAVSLPMTDDAAPDLAALARYLRWIVDQGPVAIAVNADTGEGPHLAPDERRAVVEAAVDAVGDRVPIVAGLAGPYTAQAIREARWAADAGASALLVFPIPAFGGAPLDPQVPYAYHAAIADAVPVALILFQLQPALGGVLFDEAALERLVTIPTVVAIKEASFDALRFVRLRDQLRRLRPIALLTGNDNFILESFVLGAAGALIGMAAIATREQVEMIEAFQQGDLPTAQRSSDRLAPLIEAVFGRPPVRDYRARVKEGLRMQGVIPSATVRPPLLPVSEADRQALREALAGLGLLTPVMS